MLDLHHPTFVRIRKVVSTMVVSRICRDLLQAQGYLESPRDLFADSHDGVPNELCSGIPSNKMPYGPLNTI